MNECGELLKTVNGILRDLVREIPQFVTLSVSCSAGELTGRLSSVVPTNYSDAVQRRCQSISSPESCLGSDTGFEGVVKHGFDVEGHRLVRFTYRDVVCLVASRVSLRVLLVETGGNTFILGDWAFFRCN